MCLPVVYGLESDLWARLLDGNHAMKLIKDQLTLVDPLSGDVMAAHIPTFSMRTPFQIDGNFGCTAVLPKC
jgi:alpha-L-fucosidase 2